MTYIVTDSSTQHGLTTPSGLGTPHRLPVGQVATPVDFFKMVVLLYPTGRAWNLPEGGLFAGLHAGINLSLVQSALDAAATLDATFPDNVNFDSGDADLWEYRYGIQYNPALTLQQRMNNLYQAMQQQEIQGPENPLYIQSILQAHGFNVNVYQNIFFDGGGNLYQKTPAEILGTVAATTQLRYIATQTQLGAQTQLGGASYQFIANEETPEQYSTGGILWPTWFIAGTAINHIASIPKVRQTEFRRLVLKIKPAYTVAFLIVNFV